MRVFVGDDPDYLKNVECPGGPYMVVGNSDSKIFVSYSAFNGYPGYTGNVWKFG